MCGLVGMAGSLKAQHRAVMKDLLFFDTLRGADSTGVLSVNRQRQYEIKKMTVPGYDFVVQPFFDGLIGHGDQLWLGHNRFKTMGDVSRLNAHPFSVLNERGNLVLAGAHNGTLKNKYEIERELGGDRFGTDSEALINLIEREGCKDAIAKAEGAWAITYWDGPDNTINFIRNKERPLFYSFNKDRDVIVWASEPWMIRVACDRNRFEMDSDKVTFVNEDTHYVLEIPQQMGGKFGEFIKEGGVQGKPERKFQNWTGYPHNNGYTPARDDRLDDDLWPSEATIQKAKEKASSTGTKSEESKEGKKILTVVGGKDVKTGFEGELLTPGEYKNILKMGCSWCRKPIPENEHVGFLDSRACVCFSCLRGEADKEKQNSLEDKVTNIVNQAKERMRG